MAMFTTSLITERISDKKVRLVAPLVYLSDIAGRIEVPIGFETDLASVPRLPLTFAVAGDTAHEAAVVHDYLYSEKKISRSKADAVFEEAMNVLGISWWKRKLMWSAVRAFGWSHY